MASSSFDMQQQAGTSTTNLFPETRQPSKVRVLLIVLLILAVVLSIVFIVLYVKEKDDDNDADASKQTKQPDMKTTRAPGQKRCTSAACVISAGGKFSKSNTYLTTALYLIRDLAMSTLPMFAFTNSCSCVRVVVFMSAVGVWDFLRGDSRELWMSMLQHFQFPLELITPKGSIIY